MIPLVKLKKDLQFNLELTKVIDVMKGIAAARFYVLERQLTVFEDYFTATSQFLALMDLSQVPHPFVVGRDPAAVIMVTSTEGFLGGLNNQVVSAGLRQGGPDALYLLIGERGVPYMQDARRPFTTFPGIEDHARLELADAVRNHVVRKMAEGACGRVLIVYPKPLSFSSQEVTVETLLPCTAWAQSSAGRPAPNTIWESAPEGVIEYVIAEWMVCRLDLLFALSRLAEMAARAIHLEGSYQELLRRGKKLKQEYFRARHEVIDRSMREIFSAQLLSRHQAESADERERSNQQSAISNQLETDESNALTH